MLRDLVALFLAKPSYDLKQPIERKPNSVWNEFFKRYPKVIFGLIILMMALGIQLYTYHTLKVIDNNRIKHNEKMRLYTKNYGMTYILRNDDSAKRMQLATYMYIGVNVSSIIFMIMFIWIIRSFKKLENEKKNKSEMISMITHNARHFLSVVSGRLDLLRLRKEMKNRSDKAERDLSLMAINLQSIERLIKNLNENEVLENYTVHLQALALDIILENAIDSQQELALDKNVEFNVKIENQANKILVDKQLFEQSLMNIIHNAVKFTEPETIISISCYVDALAVMIDIADQGPGIPKYHQQNIFEPYFRLYPHIRGTGLGLGNARRCMHLMDGDVFVKHSEPGKGSVFTLKCQIDRSNKEF